MCHYSCRILLGQHLNYKTHVGHAHSLKATQQNCLWPERRNWRKENRPKNEGRVAGGCPCRGHQGWEEWVTTATSPVCSFTTSWRALWGHRQHLSLHLRQLQAEQRKREKEMSGKQISKAEVVTWKRAQSQQEQYKSKCVMLQGKTGVPRQI